MSYKATLSKGDIVVLKGTNWQAVVMENQRSAKTKTLMLAVDGYGQDMGSCYIHDIARYEPLGFEVFDETDLQSHWLRAVLKDYKVGGKHNKVKKPKAKKAE